MITPVTAREHDVLTLLADGLSNHEITRELGITEHTLKHHIHSLNQKLDARNRVHLVALAYHTGLLIPRRNGHTP